MDRPLADVGRPGGGPAGRAPAAAGAVAVCRAAGRPSVGNGRAATGGGVGATAGRASPGAGRVLTIRRGSSSSWAACSAAGATTSGAATGSATRSGAGSGFGAGAGSGSTTAGVTGVGSGFGSTSGAGAAAFLAAAFFAGAGAAASVSAPSAAVSEGAAALAAAFLAAVFLTGLGSSGCSGRVSPSRTARRSSRSAWASISVLEWVLTPTPICSHNAIISALVIPSFLASSCTRMFFAKTSSAFRWRRRAGGCSGGRQFSHVGDNAF